MDAKEFLKEVNRMCNSMKMCKGCPGFKACVHADKFSSEMVDIVETWSEQNPLITNRNKFYDVFGVYLAPSHQYPGCFCLYGGPTIANDKDATDWLDAEFIKEEQNN